MDQSCDNGAAWQTRTAINHVPLSNIFGHLALKLGVAQTKTNAHDIEVELDREEQFRLSVVNPENTDLPADARKFGIASSRRVPATGAH